MLIVELRPLRISIVHKHGRSHTKNDHDGEEQEPAGSAHSQMMPRGRVCDGAVRDGAVRQSSGKTP